MATDIAFGKQLAERLDAAYTGKIKTVTFSFDAYRATEDVTAESWAIVSPLTQTESREAHQVWATSFALLITMMVKQAPNKNSPDAYIEDYLESFDMLMDIVKDDPKTLSTDREVRYDPDQLQTRSTVLTQAEVTFNLFD